MKGYSRKYNRTNESFDEYENEYVAPEGENTVSVVMPSTDVIPVTTDDTPAPDTYPEVNPEPADEVTPECTADVTPSVTVGTFFGTLQECVSIVWRYHLKTRKHHVHVALDDFYTKALDIVDDIIEQFQGVHGIIEDVFTNAITSDDKTEAEYLLNLKNFIKMNKCIVGDNSEILSTIDDLMALIDSTIYKITSFNENRVKSFNEFVYEDYCPECDDDDQEEE